MNERMNGDRSERVNQKWMNINERITIKPSAWDQESSRIWWIEWERVDSLDPTGNTLVRCSFLFACLKPSLVLSLGSIIIIGVLIMLKLIIAPREWEQGNCTYPRAVPIGNILARAPAANNSKKSVHSMGNQSTSSPSSAELSWVCHWQPRDMPRTLGSLVQNRDDRRQTVGTRFSR